MRGTISTWTKQNLFDPATIKKSATITKRDKFKLLFRRNLYSCDSADGLTTIIRYKKMNGVGYILDVRHLEAMKSPEDKNG